MFKGLIYPFWLAAGPIRWRVMLFTVVLLVLVSVFLLIAYAYRLFGRCVQRLLQPAVVRSAPSAPFGTLVRPLRD